MHWTSTVASWVCQKEARPEPTTQTRSLHDAEDRGEWLDCAKQADRTAAGWPWDLRLGFEVAPLPLNWAASRGKKKTLAHRPALGNTVDLSSLSTPLSENRLQPKRHTHRVVVLPDKVLQPLICTTVDDSWSLARRDDWRKALEMSCSTPPRQVSSRAPERHRSLVDSQLWLRHHMSLFGLLQILNCPSSCLFSLRNLGDSSCKSTCLLRLQHPGRLGRMQKLFTRPVYFAGLSTEQFN